MQALTTERKIFYNGLAQYPALTAGPLSQWAYSLPLRYPRHVQLCFSELEGFLRDMITARDSEKAQGIVHHDLFSALLDGHDDQGGSGVLTSQELSQSSCASAVSR